MIQQAEPFVRLIAHTPDPVTVCTLAARVCYSALPYDELSEKASGPDQAAFLKGVIRSGMPLRIGADEYEISIVEQDEFGRTVAYAPVNEADGRYDVKIVVESIHPICFLFD